MLISTILSSISSVTSSAGPWSTFVALLFTRMSTGPSCASVSRTRFSSWSRRPTWQAIGTTLPGSEANSSAVACRFSSLRLAIATPAPASARRLAIALPMPRPPPVTIATLPVREIDTLTTFPFDGWAAMAVRVPWPRRPGPSSRARSAPRRAGRWPRRCSAGMERCGGSSCRRGRRGTRWSTRAPRARPWS